MLCINIDHLGATGAGPERIAKLLEIAPRTGVFPCVEHVFGRRNEAPAGKLLTMWLANDPATRAGLPDFRALNMSELRAIQGFQPAADFKPLLCLVGMADLAGHASALGASPRQFTLEGFELSGVRGVEKLEPDMLGELICEYGWPGSHEAIAVLDLPLAQKLRAVLDPGAGANNSQMETCDRCGTVIRMTFSATPMVFLAHTAEFCDRMTRDRIKRLERMLGEQSANLAVSTHRRAQSETKLGRLYELLMDSPLGWVDGKPGPLGSRPPELVADWLHEMYETATARPPQPQPQPQEVAAIEMARREIMSAGSLRPDLIGDLIGRNKDW